MDHSSTIHLKPRLYLSNANVYAFARSIFYDIYKNATPNLQIFLKSKDGIKIELHKNVSLKTALGMRRD